MTKSDRREAINEICDKCGCTEEKRKRHERLFVDEQWNIHPSKRFKQWWYREAEYLESLDEDQSSGISAVTAQNAKRIWQAYLEAKEIGIA